MFTKDQMLNLVGEIEGIYNSLINSDNGNSLENYKGNKKAKSIDIERILNARVHEYYFDSRYEIPTDFMVVWIMLLLKNNDIQNEDNSIDFDEIFKVLKVKPKKNLELELPDEVMLQIRRALYQVYTSVKEFQKRPDNKMKNEYVLSEDEIEKRVEYLSTIINENYKLNVEKAKSKQQIMDTFQEYCDTQFGIPNQYIYNKSNVSSNNDYYPLANYSIDQQIEKLQRDTQKIINWIKDL